MPTKYSPGHRSGTSRWIPRGTSLPQRANAQRNTNTRAVIPHQRSWIARLSWSQRGTARARATNTPAARRSLKGQRWPEG